MDASNEDLPISLVYLDDSTGQFVGHVMFSRNCEFQNSIYMDYGKLNVLHKLTLLSTY